METVRVRARYRYPSDAARDEAINAALEVVGELRPTFTLGSDPTALPSGSAARGLSPTRELIVDVDVPLFSDLALFEVLYSCAIQKSRG